MIFWKPSGHAIGHKCRRSLVRVVGLRIGRRSLPLMLIWAMMCPYGYAVSIIDYCPTFNARVSENRVIVMTRVFRSESESWGLIVDSDTLTTSVQPLRSVTALRPATPDRYHATRYARLMAIVANGRHPLANDGVVAVGGSGVAITVDLCPSPKPFDRDIFSILRAHIHSQSQHRLTIAASGYGPLKGLVQNGSDGAFRNKGFKHPSIPVALCVSGRWIESHPDDLAWITANVASGHIQVTWVNHSYSHFYDPRRPLENNFLLASPNSFESEVLKSEVTMLSRGLVPSIFFRFPGLISSPELVHRLIALHDIPIGANAWLAKGERPVEGSIVLVHGNGNEPLGIDVLRRAMPEVSGPLKCLSDLKLSQTSIR
ncbi:hypothetical protein EB093_07315 [bacterium]|nr:hypothetical protein [bacterium]